MMRYALEGRVVTMDAGFRVLESGRVYIDGARITAVKPSAKAPPAEFKNVAVHQTGGTIYPGLIELHNHLSYNTLPIWKTPRLFSNRGQWGRHKDYRRLISGPASVLGSTRGIVESVVRYVEAKCLVAGVTTSQGITLASNAGIRRFYRGYVRNVESSGDPALPNAGTRVQDVDARSAAKFLKALTKSKCLLLHLSEGVDEHARKHFLALRRASGEWALAASLAGIHCTGLMPEDFEVLQQHGASMVWSPFSNRALYGKTADIKAARDAGVRVALGSDWSPSGSKNLLGEMKAARVEAELTGISLPSRDIVQMATSTPAAILNWDGHLGSLEAGKLADLVVVDGDAGDPYDHLIEASETGITLVAIDGVPRYGSPALMQHFGETERRKVGGVDRVFDFQQPAADPVVQQLSLATAEARLADSLRRLPELAASLEDPVAAASMLGSVIDGEPGVWFLELEHDGVAGESERPQVAGTGMFETASGATPLSQILTAMELDPLTVADAPALHFERLALQPNLSREYRAALAARYGVTLDDGAAPGSALERSTGLNDFLARAGELTLGDQHLLVDQAILLFEQTYVHLQLKRAMHAADPVQRLRLLRHRIAQEPLPELEFHREMTGIFQSVRDLHTNYLLPSPYRETTAFLPFLLEQAGERYLVSKIAGGFDHTYFTPGVEVLRWNGVPIRRAIEANGLRESGSNPEAAFARGLASLTIRPLIRVLPPDEEWVTVSYRDGAGVEREFRFDWRAGSFGLSPMLDSLAENAATLGFDLQMDATNEARKQLFAPRAAQAPAGRRVQLGSEDIATSLPAVFRARVHNGCGYIRIFTFQAPSADAFIREFARLAGTLPEDGLILDVRGNGGGLILAAEGLLQLLTPHAIEPEPAQFVTTPLMTRLCAGNSPSIALPGLTLADWLPSMNEAVRTGAVYSTGYSITPRDWANNLGQRYHGPVVLITDALCYSATDMFAAGFQDHAIGPVVGVHGNTGAGGANVWTHDLLARLAGPGSGFAPLPKGAGMRVAVRRMVRVGTHAGAPLEDLGVIPNEQRPMTERDLLEGNADLLDHACRILAKLPRRALRAERVAGGLALETRGIDLVDLYVNGRPAASRTVRDGNSKWKLRLKSGDALRLDGFFQNKLAARRII